MTELISSYIEIYPSITLDDPIAAPDTYAIFSSKVQLFTLILPGAPLQIMNNAPPIPVMI